MCVKVQWGGRKNLEYQLDSFFVCVCVCVCLCMCVCVCVWVSDLALCRVPPRATLQEVLLRIIPRSLMHTHTHTHTHTHSNPASSLWVVHQTACQPKARLQLSEASCSLPVPVRSNTEAFSYTQTSHSFITVTIHSNRSFLM